MLDRLVEYANNTFPGLEPGFGPAALHWRIDLPTDRHARVDRIAHATTKRGARVEYALPIWSDRIGLIGKCDVVEFWSDGVIYPVEYKHGPRRQHDNDDLQIAAQALSTPACARA